MSKDTGKRRRYRHRGRAKAERFVALVNDTIRMLRDAASGRKTSPGVVFQLLYGAPNPPPIFPKPRVLDPNGPTAIVLDGENPYCIIGESDPHQEMVLKLLAQR